MILQVKVKPNAKKALLEERLDGTWIAHVNAVPVDGKANARLIEIVAEHFGVRKNQVSIRTGAAAKLKLLHVEMD